MIHIPGTPHSSPDYGRGGYVNCRDFKVRKVEESGGYLIALVEYRGLTNFEGQKLLVYKGKDTNWLLGQEILDPHFSTSADSPVARFRPDDTGWQLARALTKGAW